MLTLLMKLHSFPCSLQENRRRGHKQVDMSLCYYLSLQASGKGSKVLSSNPRSTSLVIQQHQGEGSAGLWVIGGGSQLFSVL
jgi:hypothetical protein